MSNAKYIGNPALAYRVRTERDPQRGVRQSIVYECATEADADVITAGTAVDQQWIKEPDPPGWRVTVYTPDATTNPEGPFDVQNVWELLNNRVEKDLYEHPKSKAIDDENIKAIRRFLKSPVEGADPALIEPTTRAEAQKLFDLLLKGTNKYTTGEFVLRYTVTVSNRAAVSASFEDVEKLFTQTQLITHPNGVTPPAGIGFSLSSIPAKSAPTGYLWSWLKIAPTVRYDRGKIVISQEFWLDLWSTWIYTQVT